MFWYYPMWEHVHFDRRLNKKGIIKAYYAPSGFPICVPLSSLLSNYELDTVISVLQKRKQKENINNSTNKCVGQGLSQKA